MHAFAGHGADVWWPRTVVEVGVDVPQRHGDGGRSTPERFGLPSCTSRAAAWAAAAPAPHCVLQVGDERRASLEAASACKSAATERATDGFRHRRARPRSCAGRAPPSAPSSTA